MLRAGSRPGGRMLREGPTRGPSVPKASGKRERGTAGRVPPGSIKTTVVLPEALVAEIDRLAALTHRSRVGVIRFVLERYLPLLEREGPPLPPKP